MHNRRYEVDDEDDDDIVRDKQSVRVPILVMDALQREIHDHPSTLETVMSNNRALDYAARCLTGDSSSQIGEAAQRRVDDAYSDYETRLTTAWRNPGSTRPAAGVNDDRRNINDVEVAYATREHLLTNAWRSR